MSLELLNTLGTMFTVVIVATAAIAALVQLRHLRAGNQINAMLSIGEALDSEFLDGANLVARELATALEDPDFRAYSVALTRGLPPTDVKAEYARLRRVANALGNKYEELGILVNHGIVDKDIFIERYCNIITLSWNNMQAFTALEREAAGTSAIWENYEFLAVLSQDWSKQHPEGIYPKGYRRLQLQNPWPVPPMPATTP